MKAARHVQAEILESRVLAALQEAGADEASSASATQAMMHASRFGIDSHGVRLTAHYARMLRAGRLNPRPKLTAKRTAAASAMLDGDDGLGHHAAYAAMAMACELALESGIGAVGVRRSSHYGAAGAYALAAAEAGFIGLSTTNSDSAVALHDGLGAFHGTNPIAAAAPVSDGPPWLLDMATSSIPLNRVHLYRSLDKELPADVAVDGEGRLTRNPFDAATLLPLGGAGFGHKGAGLAGLVTLLSAVLTGGTIDPEIALMVTGDPTRPRNLGHFCLAIDPDKFIGRAAFDAALQGYLDQVRDAPAVPGGDILAPGDREWRVARNRAASGIPIDPDTAAFLGFDDNGA